ncbi:TonB-dependent receptor plug domain-containing protein, partial [Candidatus Auribacterota bacterium]
MRKIITSMLAVLIFFPINSLFSAEIPSQAQDALKEELKWLQAEMNIQVITASLKEESIWDAPSNITVITRDMIERRGYRNLVEICEDIPGFDFLAYEDGAGEYTSFSKNRGIGDLGNQKILIMVDGIVQNFISKNFSILWNFEHLYSDIDRIEIIQGPGSALYGAQAFSGIINFITNKRYEGVYAKAIYGSHKARDLNVNLGYKLFDDFYISLAARKFDRDGDGGDRYDPGGYFHGNIAPYTLTQDYDAAGNYVTNIPNPIGGQPIPDGFGTWADATSFRLQLSYKESEMEIFYYDEDRSSGCYIPAYEYKLTVNNHRQRHRGYHVFLKNNYAFNDRYSLESNIVYRTSSTMPKSGVEYQYRFANLTKNWNFRDDRSYIEERLNIQMNENDNIIVGLRLMWNTKQISIISLGKYGDKDSTSSESSWTRASAGEGLNLPENFLTANNFEFATYSLLNKQITKSILSSVGLRYDYSKEYKSILNPRIGLIFKPSRKLALKLLYGTAFRQSSIYELTSLWLGNPNLKPEKIHTFEIELDAQPIEKIYL